MNKGKHSSSKVSNNDIPQMEDIFSSSNKKRKGKNVFLKIVFIVLILQILVMAGSTIYAATVGFLPSNYLYLLIGVELATVFMQLLLIFQKKLFLLIQTLIMAGTTIYIKLINLIPNNFVLLLAAVEAFVACVLLLIVSLRGNERKKIVLRSISLAMSVFIFVVTYFGVGTVGAVEKSFSKFDNKEENFEVAPVPAEVEKEPFFIYLSGSDTRNINDIPEEGLADVNMILAVDPVKHKMLMVNTPRDYYVALDGDTNKMDKLTHAGNYGIKCSMDTLAALYDIKFNYYIRVNFTSLVDIVDELGGVTVNSELAFSSRHSLSKKTYTFKKGQNNLTGDAALAFARERKAFAAGDRQRGKNQQLLIKAIINKAISPSILNPSNLEGILSAITRNTKLNISNKEIEALLKSQLNNMSGWDIDSISVDGTGSSQYTYSYSSKPLYVMIPDEDTVKEAQKALSAYKK